MINIKLLREGFAKNLIKKAIAIAKKSTGNFDKAYDAIEKLKKGLGDQVDVALALKTANEAVALGEALSGKAKAGFKTAMKTIKKDKEVKRLKSKSDVETFMDYTGADIIFAMDLGDNESNAVIAAVTTELQKGMKEAVNVDMRTKGYKEAISRGLIRTQKKEDKKKANDAITQTIKDANKSLTGKNEDMAAGGSDATGDIAGKDTMLGKKKKIIKRKGFKESLAEAKSDCTVQNDGRMNLAVCIDGLSFQDARKGTRGAMMNIKDFQKTAKIAYAGAKGKATIPAVKKELKMLGAKNYYAKWQADSSSYKDDSIQIWYTK